MGILDTKKQVRSLSSRIWRPIEYAADVVDKPRQLLFEAVFGEKYGPDILENAGFDPKTALYGGIVLEIGADPLNILPIGWTKFTKIPSLERKLATAISRVRAANVQGRQGVNFVKVAEETKNVVNLAQQLGEAKNVRRGEAVKDVLKKMRAGKFRTIADKSKVLKRLRKTPGDPRMAAVLEGSNFTRRASQLALQKQSDDILDLVMSELQTTSRSQ